MLVKIIKIHIKSYEFISFFFGEVKHSGTNEFLYDFISIEKKENYMNLYGFI